MRKFEKPNKQKQLGKAGQSYLQQILAILNDYEFKKVSRRSLEDRESLQDFVKQQEDAGLNPQIPQKLLTEANRKNFKLLTFDELKNVSNTARNIDKLSRLKNKLLTAKEERDFDKNVARARTSIAENSKGVRVPEAELQPNPTTIDNMVAMM